MRGLRNGAYNHKERRGAAAAFASVNRTECGRVCGQGAAVPSITPTYALPQIIRRHVRLLRAGCGILFSAGYVGTLLVVATPLNCQFLADKEHRYKHHDFADTGVCLPCVLCARCVHCV